MHYQTVLHRQICCSTKLLRYVQEKGSGAENSNKIHKSHFDCTNELKVLLYIVGLIMWKIPAIFLSVYFWICLMYKISKCISYFRMCKILSTLPRRCLDFLFVCCNGMYHF